MRYFALFGVLMLSTCGPITPGPEAARQRAQAAADVPDNEPHPLRRLAPVPGSLTQLSCWDNGEEKVCKTISN